MCVLFETIDLTKNPLEKILFSNQIQIGAMLIQNSLYIKNNIREYSDPRINYLDIINKIINAEFKLKQIKQIENMKLNSLFYSYVIDLFI